MKNINETLLSQFITRHIDLMRYETAIRKQVFDKIDEMQDDTFAFLLSGSLKKAEHIIAQGYEFLLKLWDVLPVLDSEMLWLYGALGGLAAAFKLKDKIAQFAKNKLKNLAENFTINGLTLPENIAQMRDNLVAKVKQIARFAQIDDVLPSIDDVKDAFNRAKNHAKTFSKTWINSAAHTAHQAFATINPFVKGFRHISVLDGHTSSVCTHRHGLLWDKKHNPIQHNETFKRPPLHPNCRSKMVYVYDLKQPFDGISGSDWVKSRSLAQLQEQFGKGIGQMLFDGTIQLHEAMDGLTPLTLAKLQDKFDTPEVIREIQRKNWTDEFKQKSIQFYYQFKNSGFLLDTHAISRLHRLEKKGFVHIQIEQLLEYLQNNSANFYQQADDDNGNREIFFSKEMQIAVIQSQKDGKIITIVRMKQEKSEWIPLNKS